MSGDLSWPAITEVHGEGKNLEKQITLVLEIKLVLRTVVIYSK